MNISFKEGLFMLVIFILLMTLSNQLSFSQQVIGDFSEKKQYARALQLQQSHRYIIALKKGEFASLTLDQMGIDVVIHIVDPNGNKLEEFDTPNGNSGPEMILIDATEEGRYKVDIAPLGEKEKPVSGRYHLSLNGISSSIEEHLDIVLSGLGQRNEIPGFAVSIVTST